MERRPAAVDVGVSGGDALRRARALGAPTRVAVLDALRLAAGPLTPQDLAAAVGVHHTAVRQHLAVLADAGLVAAVPLAPAGRGRPRVAYRPLADPQPYQQLATALIGAVAAGGAARQAGAAHGAKVSPSPRGALATLFHETERLGFQPHVRSRGQGRHELILGACPFADVAAISPDVVCDLHMGLAEGIVARAGGIEVTGLKVADPHRGGCRFTLRETAKNTDGVT